MENERQFDPYFKWKVDPEDMTKIHGIFFGKYLVNQVSNKLPTNRVSSNSYSISQCSIPIGLPL